MWVAFQAKDTQIILQFLLAEKLKHKFSNPRNQSNQCQVSKSLVRLGRCPLSPFHHPAINPCYVDRMSPRFVILTACPDTVSEIGISVGVVELLLPTQPVVDVETVNIRRLWTRPTIVTLTSWDLHDHESHSPQSVWLSFSRQLVSIPDPTVDQDGSCS